MAEVAAELLSGSLGPVAHHPLGPGGHWIEVVEVVHDDASALQVVE